MCSYTLPSTQKVHTMSCPSTMQKRRIVPVLVHLLIIRSNQRERERSPNKRHKQQQGAGKGGCIRLRHGGRSCKAGHAKARHGEEGLHPRQGMLPCWKVSSVAVCCWRWGGRCRQGRQAQWQEGKGGGRQAGKAGIRARVRHIHKYIQAGKGLQGQVWQAGRQARQFYNVRRVVRRGLKVLG